MIVKNIKTITIIAICTTISTTSLLAHATLTIRNNTSFSSSAIINDGMCSNEMGTEGITAPNSGHVISDEIIGYACDTFPCKAEIFANDSCSRSDGNPIAIITIADTNTIATIDDHHVGSFKIAGGGNYVEVNGG